MVYATIEDKKMNLTQKMKNNMYVGVEALHSFDNKKKG